MEEINIFMTDEALLICGSQARYSEAKVAPAQEFLLGKGLEMPVIATVFERALQILDENNISHVFTQLGATNPKIGNDWAGIAIANFAVNKKGISRDNILITTNGGRSVISFVEGLGYKVVQPDINIAKDLNILFNR